MNYRTILVIALIVFGGLWYFSRPTGAPSAAQAPTDRTDVVNRSFEQKTSDADDVIVTATPVVVASDADTTTLVFDIVLETHSVELDQNLAATAELSVEGESGGTRAPERWEGDPPGGHHRKGRLVFGPIPSSARAVTLRLSGIGSDALRVFQWSLR